jgi:hypothetical protein
VKIIKETTAARSPVDHPRDTHTSKGTTKKKIVPIVLSINSRDFRGATSAKVPATRREMTERIIIGKLRTDFVFNIQFSKLVSISGTGGTLAFTIC